MNKETEKRVNRLLEKMRTAMPEVERQVMVYEKNVKAGKQQKLPTIAPQFRNS